MSKKPFEPHYRVFTNNTNFVKVGCTYAGKMYYGVAICAPEDTFSYDYGYKLAKARCDYKINTAKMRRSQNKISMYKYYRDLFCDLMDSEILYEQQLHMKWIESLADLEAIQYEGNNKA